MIPMLFGSVFLWAFIGASLLLCTAYLEEYTVNHAIGRVVLGSSVYISLGVSALMTVLARRFAVPKAFEGMVGESYSDSRITAVFTRLCMKMGMFKIELREAKIGNAFSIAINGRKLVAVSPALVKGLSMEETEAVLAHELSHLKNRDSIVKGLARFARFAFPYDPVVRLIEAAIHRERELLADRSSVRVTRKPLALASALIRVHSGRESSLGGFGAGLFMGGKGRGLLSLYPDLRQRIDFLLKLAQTMRVVAEVPA